MRGMDLFCASPASTAICSSLDHRSMVRRGTRPIDRQMSKHYVPCASESPLNPKPYDDKSRKSLARQSDLYRKSSADAGEGSIKLRELRRKSTADINDLRSPHCSSRYLLGDAPFIDWISESDHVPAFVPTQHPKPRHSSSNDSPARRSSLLARSHGDWISEADDVSATVPGQIATPRLKSSNHSLALKSSSSARSHHQVVVLRVSIHCKACEGKVRKHISKMEGVTSFSIDLATKKVTVIGDVTPLGVLASLSKVKSAQLWPSPTTTTPFPSPSPRWST